MGHNPGYPRVLELGFAGPKQLSAPGPPLSAEPRADFFGRSRRRRGATLREASSLRVAESAAPGALRRRGDIRGATGSRFTKFAASRRPAHEL